MRKVNLVLYIIIAIVSIICIFLIIKLYLIKKSIREIEKSINWILEGDTNNLLTVSSADTDIKRLANSLNIKLKNLRNQKLQYVNGNQELKKSITNIAHDLRTPLTSISGYVDLLKTKKGKERQEEYLNIIDRKTNDLILLTEQLFDFSKTMDMSTKIEKNNLCLNEILEETLTNYYILFKENNIEPNINITDKQIYKMVDRNAIIRVFENILSNVIKYSNGEFNVTLNEKGEIIFSNKSTMLDATTVQKIFNRYFTVEDAKESTGLGLSIAKQLVELNNGNISAKYINGKLIIKIIL